MYNNTDVYEQGKNQVDTKCNNTRNINNVTFGIIDIIMVFKYTIMSYLEAFITTLRLSSIIKVYLLYQHIMTVTKLVIY